ncbi:MAG: glycosyltransferase, partial [Calditrichaeota bacterium]
ELKKLAAELKIQDSVKFTGYVSTEEKVERLRKSHVAVLPSLKEGWGLTNIEANSVGTTVVAANSPGLRDSVKDNETGFLYEYGNVNELSEKLISVLTDEILRKRLEQGGLEWAERFNWDNAAQKFNKLIEKVVREY